MPVTSLVYQIRVLGISQSVSRPLCRNHRTCASKDPGSRTLDPDASASSDWPDDHICHVAGPDISQTFQLPQLLPLRVVLESTRQNPIHQRLYFIRQAFHTRIRRLSHVNPMHARGCRNFSSTRITCLILSSMCNRLPETRRLLAGLCDLGRSPSIN